MARRELTFLNNFPLPMYSISEYSSRAYNQYRNSCQMSEPCWCPTYLQSDPFSFQFKAEELGSNLFATQYLLDGTNTGVTAGKLVDAGENFTTQLGVTITYLVENKTTNESTYSTANGTTTMDLYDDIFTATPEDYRVWKYKSSSNAWQISTSDDTVCATNTNAELSYPAAVTVGKYYRITLTVTNYSSGSLNVWFGDTGAGTNVGTISGNGTYTFYGQVASSAQVIFAAPVTSQFTGCIDLSSIEMYQLNTDYYLDILDNDDNVVYSNAFTETEACLNYGNIEVDIATWSLVGLANGCYTYRIAGNTNCQLEDLMGGAGAMTSADDWTLSAGTITIGSGVMSFATASGGDNALLKEVACELQPYTTYDITFTISNRTEGGIYFELSGVSPVQSGSYSFDGTYTIQLTTDATVTDVIKIVASTTSTTLDLNNVTIKMSADDYTFAGRSECFCLVDADACSIMIKYRNNLDNHAFGYYYGDNTYYNYFRVSGRLRNVGLEDLEYNEHKNSLGYEQMTYANMREVAEFAIAPMPEWAHRVVQQAFRHNLVYLDTTSNLTNNIRYVSVGAITPDYSDDSELCRLVFNVARYDQTNLVNTY